MSKAERTKSDILDAAWNVIARQGAGTLMDDVVRETGMSRPLLHLHFDTREALLLGALGCADTRFGLWRDFETALGIAVPAACLDAVLQVWIGFLQKIQPLVIELAGMSVTDNDVAPGWGSRMGDLRDLHLMLVQRFQEQGALHGRLDPESAADFIWATSSVSYWTLLVVERGWSAEAAAQMIRRTIRETVLAPSAWAADPCR